MLDIVDYLIEREMSYPGTNCTSQTGQVGRSVVKKSFKRSPVTIWPHSGNSMHFVLPGDLAGSGAGMAE
jgi:hypothetical protein